MNNKDQNIPKVSVIMPFYNAGEFLDEAITSILNQTFSNFELIIVNDASTDNSSEVVKKYLTDSRVVYVENKTNLGLPSNCNLGIRLSRADIIARMDGDDISELDRLEKEYDFLKSNPDIALVGTFASVVDEKNNIFEYKTFPQDKNSISKLYFYHYPFLHATIMCRKKDILEIGGYREDKNYMEDIDLFLRFMMSGKKGENIPEYLYRNRKHANSTDKYFVIKKNEIFKSRIEYLKKYKVKGKLGMYIYTFLSFFLDTFISSSVKNSIFKITKRLRIFELAASILK